MVGDVEANIKQVLGEDVIVNHHDDVISEDLLFIFGLYGV